MNNSEQARDEPTFFVETGRVDAVFEVELELGETDAGLGVRDRLTAEPTRHVIVVEIISVLEWTGYRDGRIWNDNQPLTNQWNPMECIGWNEVLDIL